MRVYANNNLNQNQDCFAPIVNKLRVMPQGRVQFLLPGKNPDHYFLKASKQALRNEILEAVDSLTKGLEIRPTHLLCRFSHGVLMFKLGLIVEAKNDFQMVSSLYSKELSGHFNHALCLYQLGEYAAALEALSPVAAQCAGALKSLNKLKEKHNHDGNFQDCNLEGEKQYDYQLFQDATLLRARCLWKKMETQACDITEDTSEENTELLTALKYSRKFEVWNKLRRNQRKPLPKTKDLLISLQNSIYREYKPDIKVAVYEYEQLHSKSQPRLQGPLQLQTQSTTNHTRLARTFTQDYEVPKLNHNIFNFDLHEDVQANRSECVSFKSGSWCSDEDGHMDTQLNSTLQTQTQQMKQKQQQLNTHVQLQRLKTTLIDHKKSIQANELAKKMLAIQSIEKQFYDSLREQQVQVIDKGYEGMRFYKMYAHLVEPVQSNIDLLKLRIKSQIQSETVKKHSTTKGAEISRQKLRRRLTLEPCNQSCERDEEQVRKYKIQQRTLAQTDLTWQERNALALRFDLEQSLLNQKSDDMLGTQKAITQEQFEKIREDKLESLNRMLAGGESSGKQVVQGTLKGSLERAVFGVQEINSDAAQLEALVRRVNEKVDQVSAALMQEMQNEGKAIFEYSIENERLNTDTTDSQSKENYNRQYIQDMRKELDTSQAQPDCLIGIMTRHNENIDKCRDKAKYDTTSRSQEGKNHKTRLSRKQTELIYKEFAHKVGNQRYIEVLLQLLESLSWFQNYSLLQKTAVCQEAGYLIVPERTVIFNQGDLEDNQYIIVKGRVAVEVKRPELGNLPQVTEVVSDGALFGVIHHQNRSKTDNDGTARTRKTSCIAVEETHLLVLDKNLVLQLGNIKSQEKKCHNVSLFSHLKHHQKFGELQNKDQEQENRIRFLRGVKQFEGITNRDFLVSLAKRMVNVLYKYGEVILKQGDVPPRCYMIETGLCKVIMSSQGERLQLPKSLNLHAKGKPSDGDVAKPANPLLVNFNPNNSALRQINFMQRRYQNARICVDQSGSETKNKVLYEDQLEFKVLKPGDTFGGRTLLSYEQYRAIKQQAQGSSTVKRRFGPGQSKAKIEQMKSEESDETYLMKALLTVIADTAQVSIWTLDQNSFVQAILENSGDMLEAEQRQIQEAIVAVCDPDRGAYHSPDITYIKKQQAHWDKFKQKYVLGIVKNKEMDLKKNSER